MVAEMSLLLNVAVEPYEESNTYTGNETETDTRILNNSFCINGLNVVHIVR